MLLKPSAKWVVAVKADDRRMLVKVILMMAHMCITLMMRIDGDDGDVMAMVSAKDVMILRRSRGDSSAAADAAAAHDDAGGGVAGAVAGDGTGADVGTDGAGTDVFNGGRGTGCLFHVLDVAAVWPEKDWCLRPLHREVTSDPFPYQAMREAICIHIGQAHFFSLQCFHGS